MVVLDRLDKPRQENTFLYSVVVLHGPTRQAMAGILFSYTGPTRPAKEGNPLKCTRESLFKSVSKSGTRHPLLCTVYTVQLFYAQ